MEGCSDLSDGTRRIAPQFHSSDSWILLSIAYAGRKKLTSLVDIIALADAINHAIPTTREMDRALNRLLDGRLISHKRGTFTATKTGLAAIKKVERRSKGVLTLWDNLHKLLSCPCCGPRLRHVRRRITITDEIMKRTYEAYQGYWQRKRRQNHA
jgi:hypothetical protein